MLKGLSIFFFFLLSVNSFKPEDEKPQGGVYQYQSSFRGPYGGTHVPFWELGGTAVLTDNNVRLTPNQKSKKGYIWSLRTIRHRDWETIVSFSVGSESRIGADGIAMWFTKERNKPGSVYGASNRWTGLLVAFDTFDNDGKRDNPAIFAVVNDGRTTFDTSKDGQDVALARCQANFRQINRQPEEKSVRAKVRYVNRELSVYYDLSEVIAGKNGWEHCFTTTIDLPESHSGYYIGLTAETGDLSDYHDIKFVQTWAILTEEAQKSQKAQRQETQKQQQAPQKTIYQKPIEFKPKEENQVLQGINDLEERHQRFAQQVEKRFLDLEAKIDSTESSEMEILQRLENAVNSKSNPNTVLLQQELNSAMMSVQNLQKTINLMQVKIDSINQQNFQSAEEKVAQISYSLEGNSSWGWLYFALAEILLVVAVLICRNTARDDDKDKLF